MAVRWEQGKGEGMEVAAGEEKPEAAEAVAPEGPRAFLVKLVEGF